MEIRPLKLNIPVILLFIVFVGSIFASCSLFAEHRMSMYDPMDIAVHINAQTAACCQMTSHHNPFQNVAADITSKLSVAGNFFDAVMSFVLLFMGFWLLADKTLSTYLYRLRRILSTTSNYLTQAFSQGILQPKIYNT